MTRNAVRISWWRHKMETFSALLAICAGNSPVPGEFPAQRPVTLSFHIFIDLRLNKRLSKHSSGLWFETLSHPLWRHRYFSTGKQSFAGDSLKKGPVTWNLDVFVVVIQINCWKAIDLRMIWEDLSLTCCHCNGSPMFINSWLSESVIFL